MLSGFSYLSRLKKSWKQERNEKSFPRNVTKKSFCYSLSNETLHSYKSSSQPTNKIHHQYNFIMRIAIKLLKYRSDEANKHFQINKDKVFHCI